MSILAHGVDIVDVARLGRSIEEQGERFLARVFTADERSYCEGRTKRRMEHFAARFAAKEAAMKCLGTGWANGVAWTDVSVVNAENGSPTLLVIGRAAEVAEELGIARWLVSLSHTEGLAMASVIATD